MRKPLLLSCVVLGASSVAAQAIGFRTQMNCASDYYAYCSQHAPGSPGVRKCMRAAGPKLSKACINALIADGEVSKAEVEAQKQKLAGAKAKPKAAEPKKEDVAAAAKKAQPDAKKDVKKSEVAEKKTEAAPKKVTAEAKAPAAKAATAAPAAKVTAAAQAPKPKAAAVATVPAVAAVAPAAEPAPQTQTVSRVSLDDATFEALKNRGAVFVTEDEATTIAAQPAAAPPEPASEVDPVAKRDPWQAGTQTEPAAVASETEEAPVAAEPGDLATAGEDAIGQSIEYPPGRMSLGRRLSSATAEPEPASWWDQLVDAVTGE